MVANVEKAFGPFRFSLIVVNDVVGVVQGCGERYSEVETRED